MEPESNSICGIKAEINMGNKMGFVRYYINRYENKEALIYKLIILLTTVALCIPFFTKYNIKFMVGGCAKDAVFTLMGRFVFPLLEIMSIIFYIKLQSRDNNPNMVIRYKNKKKIFMYQCIGGIIYSIECILIIYATAIGFGRIFFGVYDIWLLEGSYFYNVITQKKWPMQLAVTQVQMYAVILSVKILVMNITMNVVLLTEYITGSMRLSILVVIVICGLDFVSYLGTCGLFDVQFVNLYSKKDCVLKFVMACVSDILLVCAGIYVSGFKEYYGKK